MHSVWTILLHLVSCIYYIYIYTHVCIQYPVYNYIRYPYDNYIRILYTYRRVGERMEDIYIYIKVRSTYNWSSIIVAFVFSHRDHMEILKYIYNLIQVTCKKDFSFFFFFYV